MADSETPIDPEVVRLNTRIFEHGLKVKPVMQRAELPRETWYRWKKGGDPRVSEVRRVDLAIDQLIAEKERAHGSPHREEEPAAGDPAER